MIDFVVQGLSALLLFAGLWLMGSEFVIGPALATIAELFFTLVVGVTHHTWSIVLIGGVLFFVQLRNTLKWHIEGRPWV